MFLAHALARHATARPDEPALSVGGETLTWAGLRERVHRAAHVLLAHGAGPGVPVVSVLANSRELVETQLACLSIGAVYVPLLPVSVQREIEHVVRDAGARVLLCQADGAAGLAAAFPDLPLLVVGHEGAAGVGTDYAAAAAAAPTHDPGIVVDPQAVASIRYTSGTTGAPKGCLTTHDRLAWAAAVYLTEMNLERTDRATLSSPLAAGLGVALLHTYVVAGIPMWVLPRFDADALLDLVERERITLVYAIESTFARLTRTEGLLERDLSSVRLMYANSPGKDAASGFRLLRSNPTWRGRFFNAYGSTEAGGSVTFNRPEDIDRALDDPSLAGRTESIGRDAPFCLVECLDDDGRPVPDGEVGELVISAPSLFAGYLGLPEATAEVLRDGRLHTGDLAYRDAEGFVYMAGRKREMIKSGGLNVYPAEVEMVLTAHPDVVEVAVVGIADEQWGEKVVAVVVPEPGAAADADVLLEALRTHCTDRLAGYKRPKEYRLVTTLPKGETGKILKRAVVEALG
ncbi:fatty-acid--CoA ligase FadD5 [Nocardioides fonticola]|uniref:Fatty-acid--CoA ligase FadD5 n=1 Tax=Nocardioides fonticola TaxID=450363 RepID=A0ABP7XDX5_9ACTN